MRHCDINYHTLGKNIPVLSCIWNFFVNVKGTLKKVSSCRTDVLHYCDRLLICFILKFDQLTQFHQVGVKKKHTKFFQCFEIPSNANQALTKVKFSSCRAEDALNYCKKHFISSHMNFGKIITDISYGEIFQFCAALGIFLKI